MRTAVEADALWKAGLRPPSHRAWKTLRVSHSSHSPDDDRLFLLSTKLGRVRSFHGRSHTATSIRLNATFLCCLSRSALMYWVT